MGRIEKKDKNYLKKELKKLIIEIPNKFFFFDFFYQRNNI
jgi:hypothetical protein